MNKLSNKPKEIAVNVFAVIGVMWVVGAIIGFAMQGLIPDDCNPAQRVQYMSPPQQTPAWVKDGGWHAPRAQGIRGEKIHSFLSRLNQNLKDGLDSVPQVHPPTLVLPPYNPQCQERQSQPFIHPSPR